MEANSKVYYLMKQRDSETRHQAETVSATPPTELVAKRILTVYVNKQRKRRLELGREGATF